MRRHLHTGGVSIPGAPDSGEQAEAQDFLDRYHAELQPLYYASAEAERVANTRIVEGDTVTGARARTAKEALAGFTGSAEHIVSEMLGDDSSAEPMLACFEALADGLQKQSKGHAHTLPEL